MDKVLNALVTRIASDLKTCGTGTYEGSANGCSFKITFYLSSQEILQRDKLIIRRGVEQAHQWVDWLSVRHSTGAYSPGTGPHVYVSYDDPSSNIGFSGDIAL